MRSYDLGDPQNPYTFKKYIAFNLFRWIDEGSGRRSVLVDDGTAPRTAKSLGLDRGDLGHACRATGSSAA